MNKCPNCQAELTNLNSRTCIYCGVEIPQKDEEDDLQISKPVDQDEYIHDQNITLPDDDDLGLESTAQIMENEALTSNQPTMKIPTSNQDYTPIGESAPHQPLPKEDDNTDEAPQESNDIKKLSDDEIKEIEKNLYRSDSYINYKEKSDLIEKLQTVENKPFDNAPITPPKKAENIEPNPEVPIQEAQPVQKTHQAPVSQPKQEVHPPQMSQPEEKPQPVREVQAVQNSEPVKEVTPVMINDQISSKPKIAKKHQGIAYFYKNFIQLLTPQKLHADDVIIIKDREFVLKPKKISTGFKIGALSGALVIILAIIGSFMIGNSSLGEGQVIGIVLDQFDRPYIEGATIKFTELGKTTKSNPQGFFIFNDIPTGTHEIEYIVDGKIVSKDYTTIADHENSILTLRPSEDDLAVQIEPKKNTTVVKKTSPPVHKEVAKNIQQQKTSPPQQTVEKPKEEPTSYSATKTEPAQKSGYGKVTLAANVDGAKLKVDGSVIGAGNLTYSRIKSGEHTYSISKDGYETMTGTFNLQPEQKVTLSVTMIALTKEEKAQTFDTDDYFYSADEALRNGDNETAVNDFTSSLEQNPGNIDAVYGRAMAYQNMKMWNEAHDDFIRAAEMYTFKKDFNNAISCYNKAIEANEKSVTAFLGRGKLYLNHGEYIAAKGDFDKAISLDNRNFDAYFGIGEANFKLHRYDAAIKQFKNAKSLDANNPLVYQYLSIAYMFENEDKNVKESFDKFMELASDKEKRVFRADSKFEAVKKIADNQ